jgi:hypothetical protein
VNRKIVTTALVLSAAVGCTIIVQPNQNTPVPVPTPLVCADVEGQPNAHILFNVRVERTTVNVRGRYEQFMVATAGALGAAGILTTEAALVRLDERPVEPQVLAAWGCNLDSPKELPPERVLEYYAVKSTTADSPIGCAVDPLLNVGERLTEVVTQYPAELGGRSGLRVFSRRPDLVLVIHVDDRPRRVGFDEPACSGARALLGDGGLATWLKYSGEDAPMERVVHWFVTTDELVDRATFVERCKQYEGFPAEMLDAIDPSTKALFDPLAEALGDAGAGRVAKLPLCAMLVDTERAKFLRSEIYEIADLVGTKVDEKMLSSVLSGALPEELQGGSVSVPGR